MALERLVAAFKESSLMAKAGIGAGLLALVLLVVGGVHLWHSHTIASLTKQQEQLKQENQTLTDSYNQALGQAKAFEQSAREEKLKADAYKATIEAGNKNIKVLDQKLEMAKGNYETAKSELGNCGDTQAECIRRLCLELKAQGFKVQCD